MLLRVVIVSVGWQGCLQDSEGVRRVLKASEGLLGHLQGNGGIIKGGNSDGREVGSFVGQQELWWGGGGVGRVGEIVAE